MRLCWAKSSCSVHTIKGALRDFWGFKRLEKETSTCRREPARPAARREVDMEVAVMTGLLQLLDGLRGILKAIEAEVERAPAKTAS